jgi:hypothetical protein
VSAQGLQARINGVMTHPLMLLRQRGKAEPLTDFPVKLSVVIKIPLYRAPLNVETLLYGRQRGADLARDLSVMPLRQQTQN